MNKFEINTGLPSISSTTGDYFPYTTVNDLVFGNTISNGTISNSTGTVTNYDVVTQHEEMSNIIHRLVDAEIDVLIIKKIKCFLCSPDTVLYEMAISLAEETLLEKFKLQDYATKYTQKSTLSEEKGI